MSSHAQEINQNPSDSPSPSSRSIIILLMLVGGLLFITRPSIHGNDGVQNYSYLRSLRFDKDLDFTNEYSHYMSREADWFDQKQIPRDPVTNRPINLYGVGNSILWAPWILWTDGIMRGCERLGKPVPYPRDGYSKPYEWAVGYASAFYATLGLWLLYGTLRRLSNEQSATWALFLVWLASPLFFYMYLHPSMSHANSFFLAALVLAQYLANPRSIARWLLLGLTCGLLAITRLQDGILLTSLLVGEIWSFLSRTNDRWKWFGERFLFYPAWIIGFGIAITPQLFAWHHLQGTWFSGPRAYIDQGSFSLLRPDHITEVLFSSRHGLFYWHPALLIAFIGLLVAGTLLREKLMALAAFAGQTWVIASWSIWWGGASFGHRMFISTLPFLALGALFTVGRKGIVGGFLRLILLLFVLWNFGCVVQYGLGWISRQKAVSFNELAYNNFIRLPEFILQSAGISANSHPEQIAPTTK